MHLTLNQLEGFKLEIKNPLNQSVFVDGPTTIGGTGDGFRPMELILAGLASCSSFDILSILKKAKQQVDAFKIDVTSQRSEEIPKVFTKIKLHFIVEGNILESHLKRAIDLSMKKYCSVSAMLSKTAEIQTSYLIK